MKRLVWLVLVVGFLLVNCSGGGSSSGGNAANLKDCQVCTADYQCESGWCAGPYSKTSHYRCTPRDATWPYYCPVNYYKLPDGGVGDSFQGGCK